MNLAVFLPNWIGDAVMATPTLRALRRQYSGARITAVCRPYVAGVLEGSPWVDDIVFLDRRGPWSQRWPAVAWDLRRRRLDMAVLLPNSFRVALVARLAGARRRIGFDRYLRGFLLTDRLQCRRDPQGRFLPTPIIADYNRLAQAAGCPWPGYRQELFTTAEDEKAATDVIDRLHLETNRELVCLNPGAAFGAAKHWHVESFARLAQDLVDRRGSQVLVLCGPGERDLAGSIVRLASRAEIQGLAEEPLSLGLTKALIRRCQLLVTTDSGPRHFAAAFDRPVVTLFGPTHIGWTETYFPHAVHLQKKLACGPCQKRVCPEGHHRCMKEITPAEVFAAATDLLARRDALPPVARKAG